MIYPMIWYFIFLCVLVRSNETGKFYTLKQGNVNVPLNGKLVDSSIATRNSEAGTKEIKIIKRGIVLVDEDFDVPSAIYAHENSRTRVNLNSDMFERNEGSGIDEFDEKELTNTTKKMLFTRNSSTSTLPNKEVTLTVTKDTMPSTDFESSGDDILITTKEYVVTDRTTPEIPKLVHEEIPDLCMNSTCTQDELFVSLSEGKNFMAEGTNLSLLCKSNNSDHSMLYWYKSNGTVYFLQAFGTDKELLFNIPNTKSIHSGMYKCVKWVNTETCCNLKLNLSVYEIPLYKYHIIILSLIAVACLIICLFLSVRQTRTLRTYTKQFIEKHGKVNEQLLK